MSPVYIKAQLVCLSGSGNYGIVEVLTRSGVTSVAVPTEHMLGDLGKSAKRPEPTEWR